MSAIPVFQSTLAKSVGWLDEISVELDDAPRETAYAALRAVLHAVRDASATDEVAQFAAQLPLLLRGVYYEGWDPHVPDRRPATREAFLDRVRRGLSGHEELLHRVERTVAAVLEVVGRHVSPGEVDAIRSGLPKSIRELWTE